MKDVLTIEKAILNYASENGQFGLSQIIESLGINRNSASHYLTKLFRCQKIDRVGTGQYQLHAKQNFNYLPSEEIINLFEVLKKELPFTDFCIYDGSIFTSFQHHIVVNKAIYVETNRDAIDSVFNRLKEMGSQVYKRPDSTFIYDYVNLQERCIIVKPYITEAPVKKLNKIVVPTLEKLLVDIQRDPDFDYMRGSESHYMFDTAIDQFSINHTKLMRYARRRGCEEKILSLFHQINNYD